MAIRIKMECSGDDQTVIQSLISNYMSNDEVETSTKL